MVGRIPHYTALVLAFSLFLVAQARAQSRANEAEGEESADTSAQTTEAKRKAATLFDRAVREFAKGRHDEAARLFVEADTVWPSSDALRNAIAAALRANQLVLAARAAQRVLQRHDVDPHTVQAAHGALAVVTGKLSRLNLECREATCGIQIDGAKADPGVTYVLPGRHEVVGETAAKAQDVRHVDCGAGAICHLVLKPKAEGQALTVAAATPPPASENTAKAALSAPVQPREPNAEAPGPTRADAPPKWMPMSALIGSSVATGLFLGLTTWSGVDALNARKLHKTDPEDYDPDDVRRRARRTDILLSGAVLFAAATTVSTFWWIRWKKADRTTASILPGHGFALVTEHHF